MSYRQSTSAFRWALFFSLLGHGSLVVYLFFVRTPNTLLASTSPRLDVALVSDPASSLEPNQTQPRLLQKRKNPQLRSMAQAQKPEKRTTQENKPKPQAMEEKPEPAPRQDALRLKMVEVNNPESDRPPDNARYLSDKNRRVEKETRARYTNLVKDHPRPEPFSQPNPNQGPLPGSKEDKIAEQKKQKGRISRSKAVVKPSPLLAMRSPGGGPARKQRAEAQSPAEERLDGMSLAPWERPKQTPGGAGPKLNLDHRSQDRIDGQKGADERELARLSPSTPSTTKGKYEGKWQAIRSSLENFVPEVQPGNQTALGTRADPFALYIAHMHREIHRLWGFGFLSDMDTKSDSNPMNNMKLWTMVEIAIRPNGTVEKTAIIKPSGLLTFDVAALDAVLSSAPFPSTPRAIRSANGNVYLHWRFHRDQRQCGTFGVDPYILTTPPKGPIDSDRAEVQGDPFSGRTLHRLHRAPGKPHPTASSPWARSEPQPQTHQKTSHSGESQDFAGRGVRSARSPIPGESSFSGAGSNGGGRANPKDPAAKTIAHKFVQGLINGNASVMASVCGVPFLAQGQKVASSQAELHRLFQDLILEIDRRSGASLVLMTMMEARKVMEHLPPGAEYGKPMLVGELTLGKSSVTLLLDRQAQGWRVVGLNR